MTHITSKEVLEQIINKFTDDTNKIWFKNSKIVNITKHSKSQQNEECNKGLEKYQASKEVKDQKNFRSIIKKTKYEFFNTKIQEIAGKNHGPWELMNWIKKCKLLAIEAIQYNGHPCFKLENLWQTLHSSFNSAQNCCINLGLLEEIPNKPITKQMSFSENKFKSSIAKYNNLLASRPNKLSWKHLKIIVNDILCLKNFINIANTCINLGHWPSHFKMLLSIIISKPNKVSYNSPKTFRPIVLLNTLGKL